MRHGIETAPKDGDFVILEDDAKGTYDVGHWSAEAGGWVGKDEEPVKITPTHWHPFARDAYFQTTDEGSAALAGTVSKGTSTTLIGGHRRGDRDIDGAALLSKARRAPSLGRRRQR